MSGFVVECHKIYSSVRFGSDLREMEWNSVESNTAAAITELQAAHTTKLLIDLSQMEMIHSGLVAALVRIWKSVESPEKAVVVVSPSAIVTEVLKSAGLQKLFPVVETREEAADVLGVSKGALIEQRERRIVAWGALPAAIMAFIAAVPLFTDFRPNVQVNLERAAALLGLFAAVMGLLSLARDRGKRRWLGLVAFLMSASLLGALYARSNPINFTNPWAPPERNLDRGNGQENANNSQSSAESDNKEGDAATSTENLTDESAGSESNGSSGNTDTSADENTNVEAPESAESDSTSSSVTNKEESPEDDGG